MKWAQDQCTYLEKDTTDTTYWVAQATLKIWHHTAREVLFFIWVHARYLGCSSLLQPREQSHTFLVQVIHFTINVNYQCHMLLACTTKVKVHTFTFYQFNSIASLNTFTFMNCKHQNANNKQSWRFAAYCRHCSCWRTKRDQSCKSLFLLSKHLQITFLNNTYGLQKTPTCCCC